MNKVGLRSAVPEDADFLYNLLKATMQEYVTQVWGWDEQWQRQYFQENFIPDKERIIIKGEEEIGVISTEKYDDEIFLAKIYILPEHQGQHIGTELIEGVLGEAFDLGLPVTLRVLKVNPAKRLYDRLGFVVTGETETHYLMKASSVS